MRGERTHQPARYARQALGTWEAKGSVRAHDNNVTASLCSLTLTTTTIPPPYHYCTSIAIKNTRCRARRELPCYKTTNTTQPGQVYGKICRLIDLQAQ
jgi:hypothetical protein